jgi:hypothetical protein
LRYANAPSRERRALARRGCGNATATAFVHGRPAGRPCATITVLPLQARFRNHGWRTPAALGCMHAHRRSCAIAICNGVMFSTGGLRPPLLCCSAKVCRRKNDFFHARTHVHKSGDRQPAVVVATNPQGKANSWRITSARIRSGDRQSAVVR